MFHFFERLRVKGDIAAKAPREPIHHLIERRAVQTNRTGPRPLWSGYRHVKDYPRSTEGQRTSDQVRSTAILGRFYTWLAKQVGDPVIIEIGTAFGVSGMYWLAGIGSGHLHTFEPNTDWASFARKNLACVSSDFTLHERAFDGAGLPAANIAFIDAIHTSEFVELQFALLKPLMKPDSYVLFDDINFSDDMAQCWQRISSQYPYSTINGRVGIIRF